MRALVASVALSLLILAGCGDDDAPVATGGGGDPTTTTTAAYGQTPGAGDVTLGALTEAHGCGYGFQAGRPDQRVGLFVGRSGGPATDGVVTLPAPEWTVTLRFGEDLFANWCDDVMEAGEPEPVVTEAWDVVEGRLEVAVPAGGGQGPATLTATGLVAQRPDGALVPLGDITIVNEWYGTFAG